MKIWRNRNVVYPGLETGVEELEPRLAYVEDKRVTQEEMLQTEAGCNAAEVEQVPARCNSWKTFSFRRSTA